MKIRYLFTAALLFALLAAVAPMTVDAFEEADFDFRTTEDLYVLCSASPDDPHYAAALYGCRGFITGAVQYHDGVSKKEHLQRLICYPKDATIQDGRVAFVKWGEANRDNAAFMNEFPVVGLLRALSEKYPCQ